MLRMDIKNLYCVHKDEVCLSAGWKCKVEMNGILRRKLLRMTKKKELLRMTGGEWGGERARWKWVGSFVARAPQDDEWGVGSG